MLGYPVKLQNCLINLCSSRILFITGCSSGGDKEVEVPIYLENASNVGSLQMSISYDANILKAIEVNPENQNPVIWYEDTRTSEVKSLEVEMVILSQAMTPSLGTRFARILTQASGLY